MSLDFHKAFIGSLILGLGLNPSHANPQKSTADFWNLPSTAEQPLNLSEKKTRMIEIDAIAELFSNRIVDPNGKFIQDSDNSRIRKSDEVPEFVLAFGSETETGKEVVITESDISNLIKSKGAIMAAMQVLLNSVGLLPTDLEQIFVAGGFGNYLDIEKAIVIGALPDVPRDRIRFIGNSSLSGARMAMLSRHAFARAKDLAHQMTYFELSVNPDFMRNFVASLFLPHTDINLFPSVKKLMEEKR